MSRRPHARIHLLLLPPRQAVAVVDALERALGLEMRECRELQQLKVRAHRRHLTVCDLDGDPDGDPDADF